MARIFSSVYNIDNWESPKEPRFELADKLYPILRGYTIEQFKQASAMICSQMEHSAIIYYQD